VLLIYDEFSQTLGYAGGGCGEGRGGLTHVLNSCKRAKLVDKAARVGSLTHDYFYTWQKGEATIHDLWVCSAHVKCMESVVGKNQQTSCVNKS
jgi:hypothetical protein